MAKRFSRRQWAEASAATLADSAAAVAQGIIRDPASLAEYRDRIYQRELAWYLSAEADECARSAAKAKIKRGA